MNANINRDSYEVWPQRLLKVTFLNFVILFFDILPILMKFKWMLTLWRCKFLIKWSMTLTLEVIKGHKNHSFLDIFFGKNLILPIFCMNDSITKMQIFNNMRLDLYYNWYELCSCGQLLSLFSILLTSVLLEFSLKNIAYLIIFAFSLFSSLLN